MCKILQATTICTLKTCDFTMPCHGGLWAIYMAFKHPYFEEIKRNKWMKSKQQSSNRDANEIGLYLLWADNNCLCHNQFNELSDNFPEFLPIYSDSQLRKIVLKFVGNCKCFRCCCCYCGGGGMIEILSWSVRKKWQKCGFSSNFRCSVIDTSQLMSR